MGRLQWFIKQTVWFFSVSSFYMAGVKKTPWQWVRAYFIFMRLSWNDYKRR